MKLSNGIFFLLIIAAIIGSCSKSVTETSIPTGKLYDLEGNLYKTVVIGSQTWMAENLRSTKLNDGTIIPHVKDNYTWSTQTVPARCYFANDSASYSSVYGVLYNWYTVQTNKLCPDGWHMPTDAEWTTLTTSLGVDSLAGGKLKSTLNWLPPNLKATNTTGFTALPTGYRYFNGSYQNSGYSGNWWSATAYINKLSWYTYVSYNSGYVGRNYADKLYGFSARCIKN